MSRGWSRRALSLLPVVVACALPLPGLWQAAGPPMEEGFMLVFPERLLAGDLPHQDFLHLYGPGSLWLLAAVYWVFGTSLGAQRAVGYLQHLGVVFGAWSLLRPWGPWVSAAGATIAAIVIIPPSGLSALAWIGAVAFGLWAVRAGVEALEADEGSRRRTRLLWAAGLLGGAALLYRLDLVVAVVASLGVVLWKLHGRDRRRLVVASLVGVSPYLVHLVTVGPAEVVRGMVIEPVFELRGGRALPLPPNPHDFDGFLQRAGTLDEPPWPFPAPPGPLQLGLWLLVLVVGGGLLLVAGRRCARDGRPRLLVMAAFAVGLFPQALQRADSTHLAWVSCVTLAFLPAAVVELWPTRPADAPRRLRTGVALAVPALCLLALVPHFTLRGYVEATGQTFGYRHNAQSMRYEGRVFRYARPDAVEAVNALLPLVDELTEPGDRLFVGPGDLRVTPYSEAYLYYLLPDLTPATRYIEMDPGVANAPDSGLADELRSADVAILSSIRDDWNEPNDSVLDGPDEPNEVLAEDFCLVASYGEGLFGHALFEVYDRC
ncbi:MAG: hypothetical protein ABL966_06350 [Acidimicrobiales bacterium]